MALSSAMVSTASRNALIGSRSQPAISEPAASRGVPAAVLASTIGHAAVLSDTPEKWAATIAVLKQNGVNPEGYEDFEKGRPAAIAAAGLTAPRNVEDSPDRPSD